MTMSRTQSFKIVLLGEGEVGKTSLVQRYTDNLFNEKHIQTQQAAFKSKRLTIDNQRVELAIWDTAGQERFRALGPLYYRDANGALLVFDITDEDSFDKVKSWVKELRRMLGNDVILAIAGNKIDREKDRQVSVATAEAYAKSVNARLYHTSAKLNKGVDELFQELAKQMLEKNSSSSSGQQASGSRPSEYGIPIRPSQPTDTLPTEKRGGCC